MMGVFAILGMQFSKFPLNQYNHAIFRTPNNWGGGEDVDIYLSYL